jgi:glutamyl-tRNA synthetase
MSNILSDATIERLIPGRLPSVEEIEARYPARKLKEGQIVTRQAPSPTGMMHIGTLMMVLVSEKIAHQTGGVMMLRIEDTDTKREVEGATQVILDGIRHFGLQVDEGPISETEEKGAYGPYTQSRRIEIYQAYAKKWLKEGKAYPCFATDEQIEDIRKAQVHDNIRPGYYGKWAIGRTLTEEEISKNLDEKKPFVIRYLNPADPEKRIRVQDLLKGEREFPQYDLDIPLLKSSDGLPTYHFAHVIDDHLMGTTHVLRTDEWFSSLPLHIQLFREMGWKAPKYAHMSPVQKLDNGDRRKLSKRKDPEASVMMYIQKGYPEEAVIEYLLNIANSNFEDWRKANPAKSWREFEVSFKKMGDTGALLDMVKLDNISKNVVARFSSEEIFKRAYAWAQKYDAKLKGLMDSHPDYVRQILNIERTAPKVRKDITTWSNLFGELSYFFDEHFELTKEEALKLLPGFAPADLAGIAKEFCDGYSATDSKDEWFAKVKAIAQKRGYAVNAKEFQANPAAFKGNVSDVAKIFRILLTGKAQTPDLHSVMLVMGKDRCMRRLEILG